MAENEQLAKQIFFGIIAISLGWNSCTVNVEAGNIGIWQTWGKVSPDGLSPGLKFKVPFVHTVYQMNVQVNSMDVEASCFSADLQTVDTKIQLQYHMNSGLAPKMYQKIGMRYSPYEWDHTIESAILAPGLQESIKASTTMYKADQLLANRQLVKMSIQDNLMFYINETLFAKDPTLSGGIEIANIAITDFTFTKAFNQAIEFKVKAEQEALQAENEKNKIITVAQAAAEENKLDADAKNFSITVEAESKANAITLEAQPLKGNPELIKMRALERWNGKMSKITGKNGINMIDLGAIMGNGTS